MSVSRPGAPRPPAVALATAAGVAVVMIIPLIFVVNAAVEAGLRRAVELVFRPRVGELLWNTASLGVACVAACVVLGVGAAWLIERAALPGRAVLHVLLVAPLAIPAFVNSYAWVSLRPGATGFGGALLVVTLSYFPFVYLPVVASLRGLDPAYEETAHSLGLGPWRSFLRVVSPQLRPAVLGGGLLVMLHLLAEFGALQMLRFPTFTTAIYDQYQSTFDGPAANMLAGVLVLLALVLLLGELRLRGRSRYAGSGSGAARPREPVSLGVWRLPALLGLVGLAGTALGVPLGVLGYWSVTGSPDVDSADVLATTGVSLLLGVGAAALITLCAMPVAWLYVRHRGRVSTVLERVTYVGSSLPGIVIALALVTFAVRLAPALYQTVSVLLIAYLILFLPRALVNIRATLAQVPPVLDDVSRSLGHGGFATTRRVTLPLIASGVGAGAALAFLGVVTELTATLLLAPTGTRTLATEFWARAAELSYGAAAPYAVLMVLLSAPATYLLTRTEVTT